MKVGIGNDGAKEVKDRQKVHTTFRIGGGIRTTAVGQAWVIARKQYSHLEEFPSKRSASVEGVDAT